MGVSRPSTKTITTAAPTEKISELWMVPRQHMSFAFARNLSDLKNLHFKVSAVPGGKSDDTRVSQPRPDVTYGYSQQGSFSDSQYEESYHMNPRYGEVGQKLSFPFLIAEFKGTDGSIPVALNQCLGGSATCVNVVKGLNRLASEYGVDPVDSTAFSIAANGYVAFVYVTWEDGELFWQQQLRSFVLSEEDSIEKLKDLIMSILIWGHETRLPAIRATLDKITEARLKSEESNAKKREHSPEAESSNKRGKSHS
ncbi:hypothetical protein SLS62_010278 [Diatrype stigma]|uniref:DUF7924 domain-containing protein n=1 Tax=Diatrype stigma TaxID=117547 RepID=A0AAN9YJ54_9PEZI